MKKSYLFPNFYKKIGWSLLSICILYYITNWLLSEVCHYNSFLDFDFKGFGVITRDGFFHFAHTNFMATGFPVLSTLSLLFIGFSREKLEDECVSKIRENCLVWAVIFNSALFILCNLFVYGIIYLDLMTFYVYFFLLTFIIKFNYELYRFRKSSKYEE